MTRPDSPWYISAAAVRQYLAILSIRALESPDEATDVDFNFAEDELVRIAREARFHTTTASGLLEYRGTVPHGNRHRLRYPEPRLTLLVSTERREEGPLPQLVQVLQRGVASAKRRKSSGG